MIDKSLDIEPLAVSFTGPIRLVQAKDHQIEKSEENEALQGAQEEGSKELEADQTPSDKKPDQHSWSTARETIRRQHNIISLQGQTIEKLTHQIELMSKNAARSEHRHLVEKEERLQSTKRTLLMCKATIRTLEDCMNGLVAQRETYRIACVQATERYEALKHYYDTLNA